MHALRVPSAQRGHVSPIEDSPRLLRETFLHGPVGRQVRDKPAHDVGGGVDPST